MALSYITVSDITVGEKDTYADFTVQLDAANTTPVTVNYATDYSTAVYNSDYVHQTGTLTFAAGETSKTVRVSLINDGNAEAIEHFLLQLSSPSANAILARAVGTATIIDNDATSGTPVVTINDFVVDEADKTASFTITLDRPSTSTVSMNYATQGGTAVAGTDFQAVTGTLSFAAGETAKTIKVVLLNDAAPEPGESFGLVLSGLVNATTLDAVGNVTIGENDGAIVSLSNITVEDVTVGENQAYADFIVRLDAPNAGVVTVNFSTDYNTAVYNSDYVHQTGKLTFAAGEMVKTVRVALINDAALEATENFTLNLSGASANATIARNVGMATVIDNDAPSGTPVVTINDFVVDETAKEATFVITLDRPSTSIVSMNYSTQDGSATAGLDYAAATGTLNFGPGETARTVKVTLLNDALSEPGEAFNLVLSSLQNAVTLDPVGTAIIAENDGATVSLSNILVDDVVVGESQTFVDFLVRLDAPNTGTVTVNYSTDYNTAVYNSDYVHQTGKLTFAPGEMVKTVRVTLLNDATPEVIENFALNLSGASANATIARNVGMATVIDNDAPSGTPVVSINDFVIDEAAKEASFSITLDRPSTSVVSMSYTTQNGTALAGSDFIATSGALNFAPGETAKTVKVTLLNDALPESSESFNLLLSGLSNATTLDPVGNAIIGENDGPTQSTSNITVEDVVVGESQSFADFLVRLDAPNTSTVTVNYSTDYNTAVYNSDYVHQTGELTFAPGEMVKTVRVTLLNDATPEVIENFALNLSGASANATIARNVGMATVIDNDAPSGTPVVSINDFVIDEAAKEASFSIILNRPSTSVVSMNYATQNGTALAGSDFVSTSGSLNFAPGETAKTVKVTLLNDAVAEAGESLNLVLSSVRNATVLDATGTAIIAENDGSPASLSYLSVHNTSVGEGQTYADFLVRLDGPNTGTVTVNYSTDYETAVYNSDYVHQTGKLTFAAGETVKAVRVSLLNDATKESLENFVLNLSGASANAVIARSSATATVVDNDGTVGAPVVSISDAVVDENDGLAYVTVSLDRPASGNVKMTYSVSGLTATSGTDYVAYPSSTISFAPGETAKTIAVGILDDGISENSEVLQVSLSNITGGTLGDSRGRIVIAGNDASATSLSTVSVANATALENDGYVDFQVRLSTPNTSAVSVNYSTDYNTAVYNSDYVHQTGKLVFAAGETVKTVRISLLNDATAEAAEDFLLRLSGPSANAVLGNSSASATLIDDDQALPTSATPIAGTAGPDILIGTRLADSISGAGGNDVLDGGAGNDSMAGGAGDDLYIVEQTGDSISESAGNGQDKVISYVSYTLSANVEELALAGTAANATGNTLANVLTGNASANVLDGGAGADAMAGAAGNDTYVVDNAGDTITELSSGGTDTVKSSISYVLGSGVENLTLTGTAAINGTGNSSANTLIGNTANNLLDGGAGIDTLSYAGAAAAVTVSLAIAGAQNTLGAGTDTVVNFENLTGSSFNDTLSGNGLANTLSGGAGADVMTGGAGDDVYIVDNAGDLIVEGSGAGQDTVQSSVSYTLAANVESLTLTGTSAISATGSSGAETLTGNSAANLLDGKDGNDRLVGGGGNDTLTGGAGLDKFVFKSSLSATSNVDTITDMVLGQDVIVLGKSVFTKLLGSNVPLDATQFFTSATATAGADASDRIVYNSTTGALYYDADGAGGTAATQFAKLSTTPVLSASSFFVEA